MGKCRNICLVSGSEFNKAGEMSSESVKGGDVGEAELTQGVLDNGDTIGIVGLRRLGSVDRLDDFVNH
jgi:hypothetical protein